MKKILVMSILCMLFTTAALAQLSTTSLIGSVSGPDGALPGATVTVKDNKTGKEITVTTDGGGGFKVPNLEIGFYTVTVTQSGFKTFTANEVKLEIGKDYSLSAKLEIGQLSESVTVTAGADIVNSSDAKLSGNVTNKQLTELPLLSRNPLNFVVLQAGVASNPSQLSTINGVRTSATNITIEGVNVQDNFIRANATDFSPARPIVDEVEEFSVSSQANVDDGFGSGQIQFPIRRGSNDFHGSVWDYNRNSALGANSFFNNAASTITPRPYRNRNEFGGRLAGPLPFFHFGNGGPLFENGKDKLFFFALYQKTIDRIPVSRLATVLTDNARQGLFTYTALANDTANGVTAGQLVTVNLLNPAFGTGITTINPIIASRFLANIPRGNSSDTGDTRVTTGYRFNQNGNQEQTNYTTRIDYKINDNHALKGIYRYVYQTLQSTAADGTFNVNPIVNQPSNNPFLSLGYTATFSSNFSNELNGGFSLSNPTFRRDGGVPTNLVTLPLVTAVDLTFLTQGRDTKGYNIQDNATYLVGNHSIRFGGQFQANRIRSFNDGNGVGTDIIAPTYGIGVGANTPQITAAQFASTALFPGGVPTGTQRTTANSLLAILGGIISSGNQAFNVSSQTSGFVPGETSSRKFTNNQYALYAADQYRLRSDLTLNFGLRYDYYTPVKSGDGLFFEPVIANNDDPIPSLLDPNGRYQFVGGNAGQKNAFYKPDRNNFSPNVSFAYAPKSEGGLGKYLLGDTTVIRGGFRISYINDELIKSVNNAGAGNAGLLQNVPAINPITGNASLNVRIDNLPAITAPVFNPNRTYALNNAATGANFGTVYGINPKIQAPKVYEFNFGVQREIGFNSVLEVRYVGTRSKGLLRAVDLNQIDIRSNGFLADFNRARANYVLTGNAACTTVQNPACQTLTVFPNINGGFLTNATVVNNIVNGTPADLALFYIQNGVTGTVRFLPNPGTGVVDYLNNGASSNYNSAQVELRRRFAQGLLIQANYTFSKNLTDSQGATTNGTGDTQNRFDPLLDNLDASLEYGRAITDQTHKLNVNAIYELPFGKGKMFFNQGGIVDKIVGGFQLSGILQIGSGAPITFTDPRGTLNRAGRSARQTALTNLTKEELKKMVGVYRTATGIYFLPPEVLGRNPDGTLNTALGGTGQGARGFGTANFQGQVFFNNAPGQTSGLERSVVNGPNFYNLDMTLAKQISFGERYSFRIEASAFNLFNTTNFAPAQSYDINSTTFGRITSTFSPRIMQVAGRFSF